MFPANNSSISSIQTLTAPLLGVLLAGTLFTSATHAAVIFLDAFDPGGTPAYYQSYAFAAATNADGGFGAEMGEGTLYGSSVAPSPFNLSSAFSVNGANINATASTVPGGFFTARNAASLSVTNTADDNGYYGIGAYGSRTSVKFFSPQALAERAVFHWNVSGAESVNDPATCALPGLFNNCATGRLDFLATTDTGLTFNDLFDSANNPLNEFGPGSYSYNIGGMPVNQTISLMYWTSAFVTLNANQTTQGGTFSKFANYSNTFELSSIDLFDKDNVPITDWTMVDQASGRTVFNQNGQIRSDAPEPGTLFLFGLGLGLAAGMHRRKRLTGPAQ